MSKYVNSSMFKGNNLTGNKGNFDNKNDWKKNPIIMMFIIAMIAAATVTIRSCTIDASLEMENEYHKLQESLKASEAEQDAQSQVQPSEIESK